MTSGGQSYECDGERFTPVDEDAEDYLCTKFQPNRRGPVNPNTNTNTNTVVNDHELG